MKNQLDALLQKEMDRKDFLKHVGFGFMAIMGISALVKTFGPATNQQNGGYGSTVYGGRKNIS